MKPGQELRQMRIDAKLSQGDVAKHMGYGTAQLVSNFERGLSFPPIKDLEKYAKLYSVPVERIKYLIFSSKVEKLKKQLGLKHVLQAVPDKK